MKVCPICNCIVEPTFTCSECQEVLTNNGRVEDYLGPYSAEMPIEVHDYCKHIYYCNTCGSAKNYSIKMINF